MNLDEKIKEIVNAVFFAGGIKDTEMIAQANKDLKQLFIQEAKACLPKRKKTDGIVRDGKGEVVEIIRNIVSKEDVAYNEALDKAEQNINKLLGEGVDK